MEEKSKKEYIFEKCEGFRKGSCLLYVPEEKNLYRFKSNSNQGKRYVCYNKSCYKSVISDVSNSNVCRIPNNSAGDEGHNHPTQELIYEKMKLANDIKDRCANSSLRRGGVREVFNEVCSKNEAELLNLQFKKMQRQLANIRKGALPKCLKTSNDVRKAFEKENVMKNYGMSRYKITDVFYQGTITEATFSYTIFMSPSIADEMKTMPDSIPRNFVMDVTFGAVPPCGYKQLLIVYFCHKDHIYPFLYVLMSNKTEKCYRHLFTFINHTLFKFKADSFVTDFDKAMRNALKKVFPSASLNTSWFHFCREVKRWANKIQNFKNILNIDRELRQVFKKLLTLPLVKGPLPLISGLELLRNESNILNSLELFDEVFTYFQKLWIEKETLFAFSEQNINIRITIALESFKSQISRKFSKCANFFKFMDIILELDVAKSKDFADLMNGTLEPPKKRYKNRNCLIEEMTEKLFKKQITVSHFLTDITNKTHGVLIIENLCKFDNNDDISNSYIETDDVNAAMCAFCWENPWSELHEPFNQFKLCYKCFLKIAQKFVEYHNCSSCLMCKQSGWKFHKNLYLAFVPIVSK